MAGWLISRYSSWGERGEWGGTSRLRDASHNHTSERERKKYMHRLIQSNSANRDLG